MGRKMDQIPQPQCHQLKAKSLFLFGIAKQYRSSPPSQRVIFAVQKICNPLHINSLYWLKYFINIFRATKKTTLTVFVGSYFTE